ncbi:DUF6166 domain-containing protein [Haloplanus rubicundus]|uniref:Uncharacterized protein n=1 Tax=Haloplanus rubicundus TaxID=1547898 RepID=A0A345EIA5_9EURY|nr:DUF6166 domain-containing protein [Haloplanus rubicundus]AXG11927.1 hypothetical protein DU484_18600 [Haloplanus rubicundus]
MLAKTDYSRKTKWKHKTYRGERGVGGNFVYAGDDLLDKHLFVHRVAPGGFDWGPDASDEKACQLAIALLAPLRGVDHAVEHYYLFAENFVRRELTEDTWEIKSQDYRSKEYVKAIDGRDYPGNTASSPRDAPDLEDTDLESITYAEEIALAKKYEEVLWQSGNRRENLQRLNAIWNGEEDPASDAVASGTLYRIQGLDIPTNARGTLVNQFDSMGELAAWVYYGRNHSQLTGISDASAKKIRNARAGFVQYFGGETFIPEHDSREMSLSEMPKSRGDTAQQTFRGALGGGDE